MKDSVGIILSFSHSVSTVPKRSPYSYVGLSTPGNRSLMMFSNRGISPFKNFGTFTSLKALKNNYSSLIFSVVYFNKPAALMTDLTALIP